METRTVEQVEGWSSRSVADGYAGLRELSDGEFSGAVRADGAWLFMLNGRIVGVFEGSLDDFEDADGTAYAAPHPSLPLLFSMQEQGGDTRAKYYTNDTPLSEVDDTLSDGKFTGFVELSENVLSGDYYVAYYGGRSMSVAFVGASEQVVTGDDAFERAADEVGIYEVTDVDLEVVDVPEPDEPEDDEGTPDAAGTAGGASNAAGDAANAATGATGSASDAATGAAGKSSDPTTDANAGASDAATGRDASGRSPESPGDSPPQSSAGEATGGRPADDQSSPDRSTADRSTADSSTVNRSTADRSTADRPAGQPKGTDDRADQRADRVDAPDRQSERDSGDASNADPAATDANAAPDGRSETADSNPETSDSRPESPGYEPTEEFDRTASQQRTADAAVTSDAGKPSDAGGTPDDGPAAEATPSSERTPTGRDASASGGASDADATGGASSATDGEAEWRETTTIPSLDPDLSDGLDEADTDSESGAAAAGAGTDRRASPDSSTQMQSGSGARPTEQGQSGARSETRTTGSRRTDAGSANATGSGSGSAAAGRADSPDGSAAADPSGESGGSASESRSSEDAEGRVRKLRKQLQQRKQQVQQLKERLSTLESERNEFERERDALRQEVERLEAKLEGAPAGDATDAGRQLTPAEAFDGTNLFVRYRSKGEATLDEAAEEKADRGDVNGNLRLEHHTQFEADDASVDGESFETFLTNSFEYEFVSWLVEDLLYEIRDTGHRNGLEDLYEAIPQIDRVDLHGSVSAGNGDEDTRQESFDVIVRDRMGDPLVVADLNDSREPTSGQMMGSLVDAASGVAGRHDELAGAFQVTESFFEPEALETAEAATSGGFLSREKRASFVKLSRKRGYHLCLVEARGGDFHLNVPEL